MFQGVKEMTLEGEPAITVDAMISNEGEASRSRSRARSSSRARSRTTSTAHRPHARRDAAPARRAHRGLRPTGKAGKDRAWLPTTSRSCRSSSTQYAWTLDVDDAFDKMGLGQREGAQGVLRSSSSRC